MTPLTYGLAFIGGLTLCLLIFLLLRWAFEESVLRIHYGLKDQLDELRSDLIEVLRDEGRLTTETLWAITEMAKAARTREWKGKDSLKKTLQSLT